MPSGLPITYDFDASKILEAEKNADDFAEIVKVDLKDIWDTLELNANSFDESEVVPL